MKRGYSFPSDTNLQLAAMELGRRRIDYEVKDDTLWVDDNDHETIMDLGLGAYEGYEDAAEDDLEP